MKKIVSDERTQKLTGSIAHIFLTITQLGLLGLILYRRYYLHQPEIAYNDLRIILFISLFGFWATRLFFGAVLPVISIKKIAIIYSSFVIILTVILSMSFGIPTNKNWNITILPVVTIPAIIAVLYYFIAKAGVRRIEKELE